MGAIQSLFVALQSFQQIPCGNNLVGFGEASLASFWLNVLATGCDADAIRAVYPIFFTDDAQVVSAETGDVLIPNLAAILDVFVGTTAQPTVIPELCSNNAAAPLTWEGDFGIVTGFGEFVWNGNELVGGVPDFRQYTFDCVASKISKIAVL